MKDSKAEKIFKKLIKSFDLKEELTKLVYQGFDNFEDYEKYGDDFVKIGVPKGS